MGTEYYIEPSIPYARALELLSSDPRVVVEMPERDWMNVAGTQRRIRNADDTASGSMAQTGMGKEGESWERFHSHEKGYVAIPAGTVWFYKFRPYNEKGLALVRLVAEILQVDIVSYLGGSVSELWVAETEFGVKDGTGT